jgi:hypothetical protein
VSDDGHDAVSRLVWHTQPFSTTFLARHALHHRLGVDRNTTTSRLELDFRSLSPAPPHLATSIASFSPLFTSRKSEFGLPRFRAHHITVRNSTSLDQHFVFSGIGGRASFPTMIPQTAHWALCFLGILSTIRTMANIGHILRSFLRQEWLSFMDGWSFSYSHLTAQIPRFRRHSSLCTLHWYGIHGFCRGFQDSWVNEWATQLRYGIICIPGRWSSRLKVGGWRLMKDQKGAIYGACLWRPERCMLGFLTQNVSGNTQVIGYDTGDMKPFSSSCAPGRTTQAGKAIEQLLAPVLRSSHLHRDVKIPCLSPPCDAQICCAPYASALFAQGVRRRFTRSSLIDPCDDGTLTLPQSGKFPPPAISPTSPRVLMSWRSTYASLPLGPSYCGRSGTKVPSQAPGFPTDPCACTAGR